ncbi:hypothetical protein FRC12_007533 [Ceratobasidium sp. 428]|nr:hypothetical protein FRC12_007533 [Ceratobasidium sp. 428]
MLAVRTMTEDEAASGLYSCLVTTLKDARDNDLLDDADLVKQDERWLVTCGLTLLLVLAANSETTHPSIALPCAENNNRRLDTSTCPPEFRPYFDRWAGLVSRIKALPRDHSHDLALLICRKPPITLPREVPDPFPFFPTPEEQAREDIRELLSKLCIISNAISVHTGFMILWAGYLYEAMREEIQKSTTPAIITNDMRPSRYSSNTPVQTIYQVRLYEGTLVAIKRRIMRSDGLGEVDKRNTSRVAREAYVWSQCQHPNVLRLIGLSAAYKEIILVSPWMDHGNVRDYVTRQPGVDRFNLCVQIACGLAYLHSIGVVHGNVEGANVLVSDSGAPMLGGFSGSILRESAIQFPDIEHRTSCSVRWAAPEILEGDLASSMEGDVYAFGMASMLHE